MKISITITKKSPVHIGLRVHINGGLSGTLVLRNEEYQDFIDRIKPNRVYDDKGNCAFADCKCHLNNIPCKECGKVYCKHYESDFDRFIKEKPQGQVWIDCMDCGDSVIVPLGRNHCFECKK